MMNSGVEETQDGVNVNNSNNKKDEHETLSSLCRFNHQLHQLKQICKSSLFLVSSTEYRKIIERVQKNDPLLQYVSFNNEVLSDNYVIKFATALKQNTTVLGLNMNKKWENISLKGIQALADSIKLNTSLQFLNIYECAGIDNAKVMVVLDALKSNNSLVNFVLWYNPLDSNSVKSIFDALLYNSRLRAVDLKGVIQDSLNEGNLLADVLLNNATLQELKLSYNTIGDDFVIAISSGLHFNSTLKKLYLTGCQVGDDGAIALAHALRVNKSSALAVLALNDNHVSDVGVAALANSLYWNTSLSVLWLSDNNNISDIAAEHISKAIRYHASLTELHIAHTSFTDIGIEHILDVLRYNETITTIDLTGINFSIGLQEKIGGTDPFRVLRDSYYCVRTIYDPDFIQKSNDHFLQFNDTLKQLYCSYPAASIDTLCSGFEDCLRRQNVTKKGNKRRYDLFSWLQTYQC